MKTQQTVFSHIVQKHLSGQGENVATSALCFILESREDARNGFLELLGEVLHTKLPPLRFRTQQGAENSPQPGSMLQEGESVQTEHTEGNSRPDMEGYYDECIHVLIENKFWAGLTINQPVSYIKNLAKQTHPTLLLMVVPESRGQAVWGQLIGRLKEKGISTTDPANTAGIVKYTETNKGPILAITTWTKLLSFLEGKVANDPAARNDLQQLEALCKQEEDAYHPIYSEEATNQRTPSLIRQLNSIVQDVTTLAFDEKVFHKGGSKRLVSGAGRFGTGIFAYITTDEKCEIWFGVHFSLWEKHGSTPLWCHFANNKRGRAYDVRPLLEQWEKHSGVLTASEPDGSFVVGIDIPFGQEKSIVVRAVVDRFNEIANVLSVLKPREK